MKKLFGLAVVAVGLSAASAQANFCQPYSLNCGPCNWYFGPTCPNWSQLGPWYLYWPMEAHFVAPAPTGYPYWPSAQVLPGMAIGGPAMAPPAGPPSLPPPGMVPAPGGPAIGPAPAPAPAPGPVLNPVGYRPAPYQVPSYWYDH
jgi:hypothetical protein